MPIRRGSGTSLKSLEKELRIANYRPPMDPGPLNEKLLECSKQQLRMDVHEAFGHPRIVQLGNGTPARRLATRIIYKIPQVEAEGIWDPFFEQAVRDALAELCLDPVDNRALVTECVEVAYEALAWAFEVPSDDVPSAPAETPRAQRVRKRRRLNRKSDPEVAAESHRA